MRTILFIIFVALILSMAITHAIVKSSSERGYASEWNDDHVIADGSGVGSSATLVVAASNSTDKTVADYVCTGSDDQDTINAAITALPAGGGRVQLLEGSYETSNPITMNKANVLLIGEGPSTIITGTAAADIIDVTAARTRILDMTLDGDSTSSGVDISSTDTIVSGCRLLNFLTYGMRITDADNLVKFNYFNANVIDMRVAGTNRIRILSNHFEASTGGTILLETGTSDCIVSNNYIQDAYDGVNIQSGEHNIVSNNQIEACTTMSGIRMYWANYNTITGNVITDGAGAQVDGITLSSTTTGCDHNTFIGNILENNTRRGMWIGGASCDKNIVVGNQMMNNGVANYTDAGTATDNGHNITA